MKSLSSVLFVGLVFAACSQVHEERSSAISARSKPSPQELITHLELEVVNGHNVNALNSLLSDEFQLQTAGKTLTKTQFKEFLANNFSAIPDWHGKLRVVEIANDQAIVIETVAGTHNGTSDFLGFHPLGKTISFTNLLVLSFANGRIVSLTAQPDFGGTLAQLAGFAPGRTLEQMNADLDAADAATKNACSFDDMLGDSVSGFYYPRSTLDSVWIKMAAFMARLDGSQSALESMLVPDFRLTSGGGLNSPRSGVSDTFKMAGSFGQNQDNSKLRPIYYGKLFVAVYGPVKFDYLNPTGALGFPVRTEPKEVSLTEVQFVGVCNGKVWRQYSHADLPGLAQQIQSN